MNDHNNELADGMQIAGDIPGFAAAELIACGRCSKANPPNRTHCLYCGDALELPAHVQAAIQLKPNDVESWENGTTVVIDVADSAVRADEIAKSLLIDEQALEQAFLLGVPIPVIRTNAADAASAGQRLSGFGITHWLIEDDELKAGTQPHRVRALEFGDGEIILTAFNTNERIGVKNDSITSVTVGSINEDRWDATIKRSRKETKSLDETSFSSDHAVIDFYSADEPLGYRISTNGFDFSCLGAEKKMLAVENFKVLVERIRTAAVNAKIDQNYSKVRRAIEFVWPLTRGIASKGVHRKGFGMAISKGETSTNLEQFTKYSRLRDRLK